ncbi:MAG: hypothetical protein FWD71_06245 [Oscillospiraceae bacterium]|nr:hypothetical protein [Oscillospiraceae bacterium]
MKKAKKLSIILVIAFIISALPMTMLTVSAADAPQWTYQCAQSVYPVTVDGKAVGNEWDDAVALVVNNDNPVFQQYGLWQNAANADPIPTSDLSVTYKVKWDDQNLYILEQRFDKNFSDNTDSDIWPWSNSGTLFFLSYDANDYKDATDTMIGADGTYEIFWVDSASGKPTISGRYGAGKNQMQVGDPGMDGWVTACSQDGDTYTFEASIPWKTMQTTAGFPTPAVGVKMRFTPIISAYNQKVTAPAFDDTWNQLNFYCNKDTPDDVTGEGGLELTAAIANTAAADASSGFATMADASGGNNLLLNPTYIDGGAGFSDAESAPSILDYSNADTDSDSKYCSNQMPYYVQWSYDQAYTVNRMLLRTANDSDATPRRPADGWTLSGSTDGKNWNVIYTGKETDIDNTKFTYYAIDLSGNTTPYQYYQLYADSPAADNVDNPPIIQIADVILCGTASGAAPAAVVTAAAAPTTGDSNIMFIFAVMALAAGIIVITKRRSIKIK